MTMMMTTTTTPPTMTTIDDNDEDNEDVLGRVSWASCCCSDDESCECKYQFKAMKCKWKAKNENNKRKTAQVACNFVVCVELYLGTVAHKFILYSTFVTRTRANLTTAWQKRLLLLLVFRLHYPVDCACACLCVFRVVFWS